MPELGDNVTYKCPLCGGPITAEQKPIERDVDGIPFAAAGAPGYGVPWAPPHTLCYKVLVNGKILDHVIAFDRRRGTAWHYPSDKAGRIVLTGDSLIPEQVSGVVTVEPLDDL